MKKHFIRKIIRLLWILVAISVTPYLVLITWLGGGAIYGRIDKWRYASSREFSQDQWQKPNLGYRSDVLDHAIADVVKVGMDEREIVAKLGKPDSINESQEWQYEARRPGWRVLDFHGGGLLISFDKQRRVSEVSKNAWVD